MTDLVKDGPSSRALKHLNNRNNLADLRLRKTLEQFDRERYFSMAHIDRDRFDTRDFLKNVKYCDSDYLPQSRTFLGSPSVRRRRSKTARTAPGRIVLESQDTDFSDLDTEDDDESGSRDVTRHPAITKARLLASRDTTKPRKLTEFQRAERFLRRLREQVAVEELQSHYTDANYDDFINVAVAKISRNMTPSIYTPSATFPNGPTACASPTKKNGSTIFKSAKQETDNTARFDMVYPIRLLGNIETKHEQRTPTPSPSLGPGSPGIRATPLGLPEGGAVGLAARLAITAPQPLKPWTTCSLDALSTKPQSELDFQMMRAMLRSGFRRKPLNERVQEFCQELDEIRAHGRRILPSRSLDGTS